MSVFFTGGDVNISFERCLLHAGWHVRSEVDDLVLCTT